MQALLEKLYTLERQKTQLDLDIKATKAELQEAFEDAGIVDAKHPEGYGYKVAYRVNIEPTQRLIERFKQNNVLDYFQKLDFSRAKLKRAAEDGKISRDEVREILESDELTAKVSGECFITRYYEGESQNG